MVFITEGAIFTSIMERKKGLIYGHGIKNIDLNVCYYCKKSIDDYTRTVDHLIPESQGGIRANANKVPSCSDCNRMKANQTPEEFSKTVSSIIYYEKLEFGRRKAYLTKVMKNTAILIDSKKSRKK